MPFAGIDIEYNGRDEQVYRLVWCVRVLTRVCMYNRSYLNREIQIQKEQQKVGKKFSNFDPIDGDLSDLIPSKTRRI